MRATVRFRRLLRGMRHAATGRARGVRGGSVRDGAGSAARAALVLTAATLATGCNDLLLNDPAPAGPTPIAVEARLAGGPQAVAELEAVLEQADEIQVVLDPVAGGQAVTVTEAFTFTNGEGRARIEVDLEGPTALFDVRVLVLHDGEVLFGDDVPGVELAQGETTSIEPELRPQPAEVAVQSVPTVTAIGEEIEIEAQALFATGDPVPGAILTYESLAESVLEPVSTDPESNAFVAVGEGTADVRVFAEIPGGTPLPFDEPGLVTVSVAAVATQLLVDPSSLSLEVGQSHSLIVTAKDANGHVLDRTITFGSTDTDVATVSATGQNTAEVTATGTGDADILVTLGDLEVEVPVSVGVVLGTGDVQVTLTWDNEADLDLYVTDPFSETIYYGNSTSSSGGQLDVDDTNGFGPENVFWPEGGAPAGYYTVEVDHFGGPAPANWEVRVLSQGVEQVYTGTISSGGFIEVVVFEVGSSTPEGPFVLTDWFENDAMGWDFEDRAMKTDITVEGGPEEEADFHIDANQVHAWVTGAINFGSTVPFDGSPVPASGYTTDVLAVAVGDVLAIGTRDGRYAKIKITDVQADQISFEQIYPVVAMPGVSERPAGGAGKEARPGHRPR